MQPPSEWQKLLLTALAAFIVGVAAEPIKAWATEGYRKRKLRRMCYERVLVIRDLLIGVLKGLENPQAKYMLKHTGEEYARAIMPNFSTAIFKYAMEKDGGVFFQLDIAPTVIRIVHTLDPVTETMPTEELKAIADRIIRSIDHDVDWRKIDGFYMTKLAHEANWRDRHTLTPRDEFKRQMEFGYQKESCARGSYLVRPSIDRFILRVKALGRFFRGLNH